MNLLSKITLILGLVSIHLISYGSKFDWKKGSLGNCQILRSSFTSNETWAVGQIEIDEDLSARVYETFYDGSHYFIKNMNLEVKITNFSLGSGLSFSLEAVEPRTHCHPKFCGPKYDTTYFRAEIMETHTNRGDFKSEKKGFLRDFRTPYGFVDNCQIDKSLKEIVLNK